MITSPDVYATSLSPASIDRSFRILTGRDILPLEETVNIVYSFAYPFPVRISYLYYATALKYMQEK